MESTEQQLRKELRYLPKDFVQTGNGWRFAVIAQGTSHGRILCQLRYSDAAGRMCKVSSDQAPELLKQQHTDWLYHCPDRDVVVHGVPIEAVTHHYLPSQKLKDLIAGDGGAGQFSLLAHTLKNSSCELAALGITGSYLIGAERDSSDIDIVVYGLQAFTQLQQVVKRGIEVGSLEPLSSAQWEQTYRRRGCELTREAYQWHEERKWNKFSLRGTKVDVSCIDRSLEIAERSGKKIKRVRLQAKITNDRFGFACPPVFKIDHESVDAIVVLTPTFAGQAKVGELVEARGWLEELADGSRRIVVGSSREAIGEYIAVVGGGG